MSSADLAISVDQDVSIVSSAEMGSSPATAIPLSPVSASAKSPAPKTPVKRGIPIKQGTPVKQIIASPSPLSSVNKARTQANATSPLKNSQSSPPSASSNPSKSPATSGSLLMKNRTPSKAPVATKATSVSDGSDGSDRSDPSDDEDYSEYECSPKSESTDSNAGTPKSTKAKAKTTSPLKRVASKELCPTPTPQKKAKKPTGTVVPRPLRRAPTFKASTSAASGTNAGSGSGFFSSTVFEVNVGTNGYKAIAHEDVLSKSPILAEEMVKARARPQKVYQQIIHLPPHNNDDFAQMLDFLYKDTLKLRPSTAVPDRLKELRGVMTLAFIYKLPELQRQVTQAFIKCKMLQKMPAPSFFDFAEDMFYRQSDLFNGPWTKFFHHVAPGLIKGHQVKESRGELTQKDAEAFIDRMCAAIWLGSLFAVELYRAQNNALKLTEDNYMDVKVQKIKKELFDDDLHEADDVTMES